MYLGLYERESLPTLGTTQVSGYSIWDYMIWEYMKSNHSLLWEQCRCLDNVFGTILQESPPTLGNNTGVWIMYLGIYDRESLPILGNNTGV